MNRRILSPIIIFTTISAAFAVLVVYPVFRGIQNDNEKAISQKQELAQLQEDRQRLQDLSAVLIRYQEEFVQIDNLFLDTDTPIDFFRFLDSAASTFQVGLKKTPGVPQTLQGDAWPSLTIQLEGSGIYPNVLAFIEKVEHAPYILELGKLSITEGFQDEVHFIASLKVYTKQ